MEQDIELLDEEFFEHMEKLIPRNELLNIRAKYGDEL